MVGGLLAILCIVLAPVLAFFYSEPRLFLISIALGGGFLFNGAAAQHRATLQRNMRFTALAVVDNISLLCGILVSVGLALEQGGYWSLVLMAVAPAAFGCIGVWLVARWVPGRWQRGFPESAQCCGSAAQSH